MIDDLSVNSSPLWSLSSSCEFPCSYVLDSFVAAGCGEALAFDDTLAAGGVESVGGILGSLTRGEAVRKHGVGGRVADAVTERAASATQSLRAEWWSAGQGCSRGRRPEVRVGNRYGMAFCHVVVRGRGSGFRGMRRGLVGLLS
jgi:hypothetical protein